MREDEIGGRTIGINQKTLEVKLNFKKGTKKTVKIKQEKLTWRHRHNLTNLTQEQKGKQAWTRPERLYK